MSRNKKTRRQFKPETKAEILNRHLFDKVPISDLCDEYQLQPSVVYGWLQLMRTNMVAVLEQKSRRSQADRHQRTLESKVTKLQARLQQKDAVIAEISEEFVSLKKQLGES